MSQHRPFSPIVCVSGLATVAQKCYSLCELKINGKVLFKEPGESQTDNDNDVSKNSVCGGETMLGLYRDC